MQQEDCNIEEKIVINVQSGVKKEKDPDTDEIDTKESNEPIVEQKIERTENIPNEIEIKIVENIRRNSHLTDQGFFDLKFYHNKLW